MSQKKYRQPLDLKPRPSRRLLMILLVVHLLAVSALILPLTLSWYWRSPVLFVIAFSAWSSLYKSRFNRIKNACWRMSGDFELELRNGKKLRARLLAGSLVTEWLIILHLACKNGRRREWLLLPDMIDSETYRRLSVRLRQWHSE